MQEEQTANSCLGLKQQEAETEIFQSVLLWLQEKPQIIAKVKSEPLSEQPTIQRGLTGD